MAKQVVGLFDNGSDAQAAVQELRNAGFTADDVSIVANNASGEYDTTDTGSEAAEGAGAGATGGAIAGGLVGLFVGLGALAIPGIGPVVAAGTLATALGTTALGAGIGAAAGGLVGALVGAGIPEEDANIYAEGVRRGGALVTVQAADDATADRAADILDRYNVVDIDERGASYRETGWSRFDETAEPYSASTTSGSYATSPATAPTTDNSDAPRSEWEESSKLGTAGGGLAGAATGAAIGSVGGPVGTVIGGVAGAVTGAGVGAAGDAAGEAAKDAATGEDDYGRATTTTSTTGGAAIGSATDTSYTTSTTTGATMGGTREVTAEEGEVAIPVIEEDIRVGKREVESGGVRVTTHVEETPVNEQVTLRDERVIVERRPVDQPVDASTLTEAFREGTLEVREHDEEAVVAKEARVVEEIVVGKQVEERTETIQDTVRRTDVDIEEISGQTTRTSDTTMGTTGTTYTAADTGTVGGTTTGYSSGTTGTTGDSAQSEWEESSKLGTAGGGLAGAATGAAIGSVGGPVGTVIGGVAGAVTGAGVGAAGDAAGEAAKDAATGEDDTSMGSSYSASTGSSLDTSPINSSSTRYDDVSRMPSDEGTVDDTVGGNATNLGERVTGLDLDNDGDTGDRRRDNY